MSVDTPAGLGTSASELWTEVTKSYDLRPDELRILEDACREMDLVDEIQRQITAGASLIVEGSQGQDVASPLMQEIRQHRALIQRLLGSLKLSDDDGGSRAPQARAAANARWASGA